VLIVGDGKKYITALICPNWDEMIRIADAQGIPYNKESLKYDLVNGLNTCVEVAAWFFIIVVPFHPIFIKLS
jgi:hypothetical protein